MAVLQRRRDQRARRPWPSARSEPDVLWNGRRAGAFEILLDPGLRVTEQIVPLGPGLQKFLEGGVVFASQADVGGKIDGRRRQHEVAEIRVAVLRDKRPE